ncbi:hypothetical protein [Pseudomonas protegens]|uniref:hypothetical protein n=1 Tax=Pseudomonas protegens TaxID=380021 RepID=UPI00200DA5A8|nr:hypothetical protein [Pseudomonas protegens]
MKKHFVFGKAGISTTAINIGFDVTQLDLIVREERQSLGGSRDGRPFLSAMALHQSRIVLCYALTMKCPSASHPLARLVFLKHAPYLLQEFNLVIHADRKLFSPELIERHFKTAVFKPIPPHSLKNYILERTLSKLTQALRVLIPHSAGYGRAELPISASLEDLKRSINHLIAAFNIAGKNQRNLSSTIQPLNDPGQQK